MVYLKRHKWTQGFLLSDLLELHSFLFYVAWESILECGLSLCFNSHFPGGPGLVNTGMSPFWILLELRVMEVMVTTGAWSHNKPTLCFFTGRMPFVSPNKLTNHWRESIYEFGLVLLIHWITWCNNVEHTLNIHVWTHACWLFRLVLYELAVAGTACGQNCSMCQ